MRPGEVQGCNRSVSWVVRQQLIDRCHEPSHLAERVGIDRFVAWLSSVLVPARRRVHVQLDVAAKSSKPLQDPLAIVVVLVWLGHRLPPHEQTKCKGPLISK